MANVPLKTLPVSGVFNWGRLFGLWALVGLSTLGLFIFTMIVFCIGSIFTEKGLMSPYEFTWRFYDVGAVWTERLFSGPVPFSRFYASGAVDTDRGRLVMYGGGDVGSGVTYKDVWELGPR